jgi:hypothetical protein
MLDLAIGLLTGTGLAVSAGLNAYLPLIVMGLLARYTDLIELPADWQWLASGMALVILAVLLAVEFGADKVPVVDSVNDVVQTVVRPTSGGLAFGASSASTTVAIDNPAALLSNRQWIPIAAGVAIALGVHVAKAVSRVAVNAMTLGIGAPVISTLEDATSVTMALVAIVLPILVIFFLIAAPILVVSLLRRRARVGRESTATSWASLGGPPRPLRPPR